MNFIISVVILTMLFFSCSRGHYAIDATKHSEFVLQTTNYELNDNIESKLKSMKDKGNILRFNRLDSQNITYFKIVFPPKDSIKLKSLLMYSEAPIGSGVVNITAKPEFLLLCETGRSTDTVYHIKLRILYGNR